MDYEEETIAAAERTSYVDYNEVVGPHQFDPLAYEAFTAATCRKRS